MGREAEVPADGYHGAYIEDLARDILETEGPKLADLPDHERFLRMRAEGVSRVLRWIEATLDRFGVPFDVYFRESELAAKGEIEAAVDRLREAGKAYDEEGAVWFRSTDYGDDKDRVLVRSNGQHTYFGADCAYLIDKFSRGFDHVVYVWGADHHGDVVRVKGAAEALGYDPDVVEPVIYQWVAFLRDGEPVPMGKRSGNFITLDQLLDEVGADAARFQLLLYSNDAAVNFDIEAVKRRSMDNPVYYVQYGHARIASILRKAEAEGVVRRPIEEVDLSVLASDAEVDLLRGLADVPAQIALRGGAAVAASDRARDAGPRGAVPSLLHGVPGRLRRRGSDPGKALARRRHEAGAREPARPAGGRGARVDAPHRRRWLKRSGWRPRWARRGPLPR